MMSSIFNPDLLFWRIMARLADVFALSLMWLFSSLPVFTVGAATAALYNAAVRHVRTGKSGAAMCYLHTFKAEFLTAAAASVLFIVPLVCFGYAIGMFWETQKAVAAALAILCLVPLGAFCWMFPLLSRFEMKLGELLVAAMQFSLAKLPATLLCIAFAAASLVLSDMLLYPMLFMPCITALFWSLFMEPAFKKASEK